MTDETQPARQDDEGLYGFESATPVEPEDDDPRILAHNILSLAQRLADPTLVVMAEELILACEDGDYETAHFIDGQIKERAADISTILRGLRP